MARSDRRASVSVEEFPKGSSLDEAYDADLARNSAPVFQKKGQGWYVLSGFDGDSVYYRKSEAFAGRIVAFTLKFPTAEKSRYDPTIKEMESSFHPVGVGALGASPSKKIACRGQTCDSVCCTSGEPICASTANDCTRATNGEGRFLECDGPEDCLTGKVCCNVTMDRTFVATCTPATGCRGHGYQHPRYGYVPYEELCHTSADCGSGTCTRSEADGWSICK